MSAKNSKPASSKAESKFREAFERLKVNRPIRRPKGTPVTQNNVAQEAGLVSSALRKGRFPGLVAEIQQWIEEHPSAGPKSDRETLIAERNKTRTKSQRIADLEAIRDSVLGLLVEADRRILELTMENERLRQYAPKGNVAQLPKPGSASTSARHSK